MANNNNVKINNNNDAIAKLSVATDEQKAALAALGLDVNMLISAMQAPAKKVNMGKLEGRLNDAHEYTCEVCGAVVKYDELDETAQAKARKHGVCPNCQHVFDMMSASKSASVRVKNAVSAGQMCRDAILPHLDEIDEKKLALLTDADFCQKNMKLAYPLFKEIPMNATKAEKDAMRKPDGERARFAAVEYMILGKKFVMTNDLYARNVDAIEKTMRNLFKVSLDK